MAFVDVFRIVKETGMARTELVHYAAMLSRTKQISSVQALDMIENGEIGIEELREEMVQYLMVEKPVQEDDDEFEEDNE
jgi:hypothetical protein